MIQKGKQYKLPTLHIRMRIMHSMIVIIAWSSQHDSLLEESGRYDTVPYDTDC